MGTRAVGAWGTTTVATDDGEGARVAVERIGAVGCTVAVGWATVGRGGGGDGAWLVWVAWQAASKRRVGTNNKVSIFTDHSYLMTGYPSDNATLGDAKQWAIDLKKHTFTKDEIWLSGLSVSSLIIHYPDC
jgi:hypothetical protein